MLSYKHLSETRITVLLEGKVVGHINHTGDAVYRQGWHYVPKGMKSGGDVFGTLAACKESLEIAQPSRPDHDKMVATLEAIAEFWGDHPVPLSPHALLSESETLEICTMVADALGRKP